MDKNRLLGVHDIVEQMRQNSAAWAAASPAERERLHMENEDMGRRLMERYGVPAVYCGKDGTWYVGQIGAAKLYDLY